MHKLLLMSVLLATAVIPAIGAHDPRAKRGLRRTVTRMLLFNALYLLAVVFVYPRICW
jgi:hypothetical protein